MDGPRRDEPAGEEEARIPRSKIYDIWDAFSRFLILS